MVDCYHARSLTLSRHSRTMPFNFCVFEIQHSLASLCWLVVCFFFAPFIHSFVRLFVSKPGVFTVVLAWKLLLTLCPFNSLHFTSNDDDFDGKFSVDYSAWLCIASSIDTEYAV